MQFIRRYLFAAWVLSWIASAGSIAHAQQPAGDEAPVNQEAAGQVTEEVLPTGQMDVDALPKVIPTAVPVTPEQKRMEQQISPQEAALRAAALQPAMFAIHLAFPDGSIRSGRVPVPAFMLPPRVTSADAARFRNLAQLYQTPGERAAGK
ncbi:MAG: hypothetical protein AAFP90_19400, partial [Planctomycetota bacterium]